MQLAPLLHVLAFAAAFALPVAAQPALPAPEQWVYVLKLVPRLLDPANWTEAENAIVREHFERLVKLRDEGRLILAGRTLNPDETQFGLVILETADEAEARALMASDPAVREGLMTATLFPYRVALLRDPDDAP